MCSSDFYEDIRNVPQKESFTLQNNQSYSEVMKVQSAKSDLQVATKSRSNTQLSVKEPGS